MVYRKLIQRAFVALGAATLCASLASCDKKADNTSTSGIATVVCDASFENILSQEIDVFEYIYKNASVIPYYVDEHAAIDSLMDLKTKAIVITRQLTPQEKAYLEGQKRTVKQSRIAVDAIALIVNPANPVEILSRKEVAEILSGKVTRWDQVEPTKLGNISVVFDHQGSSTVQYMRDSVLNGGDFGPNVYAQKNNDEVFNAVAKNKNAIGIIGVSWLSSDMRNREIPREELAAKAQASDTTNISFDSAVKVLKIRGNDEVTAYKPYQAYIYDGSYPFHRSVWMINIAAGGSLTQGFYSFVTSFQGQKIIQMTGILPGTLRTQMVSLE